MLVLTRKMGQVVVVPELGLAFTVLEVQGGKVRVGIDAPVGVTIYRQELWDRIRAELPSGSPGQLPGMAVDLVGEEAGKIGKVEAS